MVHRLSCWTLSGSSVISGVPALVRQQQLLPWRYRPPAFRRPEQSRASVCRASWGFGVEERGPGKWVVCVIVWVCVCSPRWLSSGCLVLSRKPLGGSPASQPPGQVIHTGANVITLTSSKHLAASALCEWGAGSLWETGLSSVLLTRYHQK